MYEFESNLTLEAKTKDLLNECENLINLAVKNSGASILSSIPDAESGALIGGLMSLYKKSADFSVAQAKAMDETNNVLRDLKREIESIRECVNHIRTDVVDIKRDVKKSEKAGDMPMLRD